MSTPATIEFRFVNVGKIAHDEVIGDEEPQLEHGVEMAEMDGASEHSDEEPALVPQPNESGELSYTFSEPGAYQIGCHQPGHYEAGMKIDVTHEQRYERGAGRAILPGADPDPGSVGFEHGNGPYDAR